jgi:phage N-6-adenine-methyltransferase
VAPRLHRVVIGGDAGRRDGAHRGNAWLTPESFVAEIRRAFNGTIDLDPCTEPRNPTGARRFYTAQDDGLALPWTGNVFCNPPYTPLEPWINKAIISADEGARVYMLLPVRTDAAYHQRLLAAAEDVLFLRGRLKFTKADGGRGGGSPAFASMVVGIGVSTVPLSHLGRILVQSHARDRAA